MFIVSRYREERKRGLETLDAIESLTGEEVPTRIRRKLAKGAEELDLVRSGLDDTMRLAYQEISLVRRRENLPDLRTAAFAVGIEKVARTYKEMGL